MPAIARGQITIVDLNDAKSLNLFLGSNNPTTQIFNKENSTYSPNWESSPYLKITPELYISGSGSNEIARCKNIVWKINGSTNLATYNATVASVSPYALTISGNMRISAQMHIECSLIYNDLSTSIETPCKGTITYTKTENSGQLICAVMYAPKGTIFKNGSQTDILEARCDMWRGSTIDNTSVTYSWYKLQSDGSWGNSLNSSVNYGCTGYTSNILSIPASAVVSFESFKCSCKDTDSSSGTCNTIVSDIISFADMSDPYMVEIMSLEGNIIKNGQGSATLKALIWRNGEQIDTTDANNKFTFSWRKYNQFGVGVISGWGTEGIKNGDTLVVTAAEITNKATFVCEITTK